MGNVSDTIELFRKLILDPNCSRMNQSTVKGYLGELLVKAKLESEGIAVEHLGNQSGYDLQFNYRGEVFRVDVKFSTLKCEYCPGQNNWGWALVHQNKKRQISCTHFVCVAVDTKLEVIGYYVVSLNQVERFLSGVGQFGGVKHGFILFEDESYVPNKHDRFFQLCETSRQLLKDGAIIFVGKNESLLRALSQASAQPNKGMHPTANQRASYR